LDNLVGHFPPRSLSLSLLRIEAINKKKQQKKNEEKEKRQIEEGRKSEGKSIKCVSADDRYNGNQPPLHTRATYLTHPGYTPYTHTII